MSDTKQRVTVISGRNTGEGSQVMTRKQTAAYLQISTAHLSNVLNGKVPGVAPLRHAVVGRRILIKCVWADEWLEKMGERSLQQC